jgi:multidrug efflux pump subunit AcrA (membrane-fusion protein)
MGSGKAEERKIRIGRSSMDFVEVLEGLVEGEKVTLFDPTRK